MAKGRKFKILFVPALTIVTTVLTLLIVIAISTYKNMHRERERTEEFLLREGLALARAIEAGVRVDAPQKVPDLIRLQKLIKEIAEEPILAGIILSDAQGKIVAAEKINAEEKESLVQGLKEAPALLLLLKNKGLVTRHLEGATGQKYLEVIKFFRPFPYGETNWLKNKGGNWLKESSLPPGANDKIIIMRLKLEPFEKARREDIYHAILMGAILVVLGSGALYFIFIVQNYYSIDRSLTRMKTYTENVLESIGEGIISTDKEGKIVTLNRRAVEILEASEESLRGQKIEKVLRIAERIPDSWGEKMPFPRDQEIIFEPAPGKEIPLSLRWSHLQDEHGEEIGSVILLRDLREVKDLQEKIRRSEHLASLGRLAAGVAHEIRNPLSSIRGFAQFFVNRFKGREEEYAYASIIVKEVDRLNRVISDLLDFARPKGLRLELVNLENICESVLWLLKEELKRKRIRVEKVYNPDLPLVMVDRDQISQALLNLLLNSIESIDGEGNIRLSLQKGIQPDTVEIVIEDTGQGIPGRDLEKIFEPFFSTKRKGTGLGLAIVHQIIENHGGEIKVDSQEGKGTIFTIKIPANKKI